MFFTYQRFSKSFNTISHNPAIYLINNAKKVSFFIIPTISFTFLPLPLKSRTITVIRQPVSFACCYTHFPNPVNYSTLHHLTSHLNDTLSFLFFRRNTSFITTFVISHSYTCSAHSWPLIVLYQYPGFSNHYPLSVSSLLYTIFTNLILFITVSKFFLITLASHTNLPTVPTYLYPKLLVFLLWILII